MKQPEAERSSDGFERWRTATRALSGWWAPHSEGPVLASGTSEGADGRAVLSLHHTLADIDRRGSPRIGQASLRLDHGGAGLRVLAALRLRVMDLEFKYRQVNRGDARSSGAK